MYDEKMKREHAGEHVEGMTREREEEMRKNAHMSKFTPDSEGSPTRLHENHGNDRNR